MTDHSTETSSIENDIRETREGIDAKVRQIQDRLSPGDVVDGVVDFVRSNGGSLAGSVGRSVRNNPVPAALIGGGLLWLAVSSLGRRDDVRAYGEAARERARHKTAELRDDLRHRAAGVAERAEAAGQAASGQARRAGEAGGRFVQDHPVVVGAAGLLLGAAVAAALPRWQREDQLYGAQSDQLKGAALRKAEDEGRELQAAAKDAVEKARQSAEEKLAEGAKATRSQTTSAGKSA
jgi:ElaB/YqjD/DUF883 family membrane-anchored ribosome-binding protein